MARVNTNTIDGITAASKPPAPVTSVIDERIALRKLQSNQPLTEDEKSSLGLPATKKSTDTASTWVKASTVNTADGPVDVDANGLAQDGSKPVAATTKKSNKVPAGFTEGPFPKELEQFFGSSSGVLGYRIETLTDKNGRTYNQLSVATGPNSSKTFGAKFTQGADGKYTTYSPNSGDGTPVEVVDTNKTGQTYTASDGKIFTDLNAYNAYVSKLKTEEKRREGQSAYDILFNEFDKYGLGSLVSEVKQYIVDGLSPAEFTLKLRASKPYQERFAANAKRIANGFKAIDEATYLGLEDSYQSIMQNYGLPVSYYEKGNLGVQKGFEDLIGGNVDPITLEERIVEGQKVTKGNKSIIDTAKQFFPTLTDGDFLAYVLNPKNGLQDIKRKVTAVEIGAGAAEAGLGINLERALELGTAGINKAQSKQGYAAIAGGVKRGSQLASMLGENPYTQTIAEEEVFGLAGKTKAAELRQKITGLEKSEFGKKTGISSGALARDRAGAY